jgi:hypothetical protein
MSVMLEVFAVGERGRDTFSLALSGIFIHSFFIRSFMFLRDAGRFDSPAMVSLRRSIRLS